jgi:molecular chaperone GrpE
MKESSEEKFDTEHENEELTEDPVEEKVEETIEEPEELELSIEEQLTLERDVFHDKWMRAVAETDNVRKRSRKDVNDARRFAQAETLRSFLDVYDNFERALQSMSGKDEECEAGGLLEGVELIFQKFQGALKDRGALLIEAVNCEFDPNVHEAVGQLAREGVEPGMVIEVAQQGFMFGDMVLRPARVIVSS